MHEFGKMEASRFQRSAKEFALLQSLHADESYHWRLPFDLEKGSCELKSFLVVLLEERRRRPLCRPLPPTPRTSLVLEKEGRGRSFVLFVGTLHNIKKES